MEGETTPVRVSAQQLGSLAWPDPTQRKGLVQRLTWICIAQSAHRQLTKYLPIATVRQLSVGC